MINVKNKKFIKTFGKNLKSIRKQAGLSQEDLANDADIPLSQVGRIERGEVNTTISTVYVLAEALKIEITDLFNFQTGIHLKIGCIIIFVLELVDGITALIPKNGCHGIEAMFRRIAQGRLDPAMGGGPRPGSPRERR